MFKYVHPLVANLPTLSRLVWSTQLWVYYSFQVENSCFECNSYFKLFFYVLKQNIVYISLRSFSPPLLSQHYSFCWYFFPLLPNIDYCIHILHCHTLPLAEMCITPTPSSCWQNTRHKQKHHSTPPPVVKNPIEHIKQRFHELLFTAKLFVPGTQICGSVLLILLSCFG